MLHALLPGDGEIAGLLALMLLTHARRAARTAPDGGLIPLAEQDRVAWDGAAIARGRGARRARAGRAAIGPYQLQAAIAAVHGEAPTARTPTGRRSSPCTGCSNRSRPIRWSRSTGRSRWRW